MKCKLFFMSLMVCAFIIIIIIFQNTRSEQASIVSQIALEDMNQEKGSNIEINEIMLPLENSKVRTSSITHVMIHYMSNAMEKPHDPYRLEDVYTIFLQNGVSTHYIIDRKGNIYRLVPEDRVAYHAGKGSFDHFPSYDNEMNDYSIGIELLAIGTKEEMIPLIPEDTYDSIQSMFIGYTEHQYQSLRTLLHDIYERNPMVMRNRQHIIGHDEYAPERKKDPGALFDWGKIGF
ncbi:N-acetylmuramoyl-L-alanine amidase [Ornithinibacillus salinisoli]|uniref:N-acetylmuramoyl-L-alanine amidase n=1 Tax=Ornithinibacillus salinisoli TaxID=1848459 RepID=A0ABW4W1K8_9BACI